VSRRRLLGAVIASGLVTLQGGTSIAETSGPAEERGRPVLLGAESLRYDRDLAIVTATGKVELAQGSRLLLADTVSFSEKTNVVTASGNVSVLEPSGEVLFADYVELTDDLRQGFIDQVRILMTDNARLAGAEGERVEGRYTRVERGVYSPCDVCKTDPSRSPVWQLRATRITHDQQSHDVYYRDAVLELGGVPVAYTPFFAHPDPTVDRRQGFLTPGAGVSGDLGTFAKAFYFFDIDASQDFTLEVTPSTSDGLLLGGEYRKAFTNGTLQLSGSATYGQRLEGFDATRTEQEQFRGHIFGTGRFNIDRAWRWGFDLQRVTDDSHLRRYDYTDEDLMTSRGFIERFVARDYFSIATYAFQDLRPGNTSAEPLVLPLVQYSSLGEPGSLVGGRLAWNASAVALTRTNGTDSRRVSADIGWQRTHVNSLGMVGTFDASVRGDGYFVSDFSPGAGQAERDDLTSWRLFPQAKISVSWPFVRQDGSVQQLLEPVFALTAAPNIRNNRDIPNEDSIDVEFDHTNLLLPSRFPGVDRLEGGQRVTYGLRAGLFGFSGGSSSLFFGQSYRLQKQNDFPGGSGLENRLSDWVGKLELTPSPWMDISYSFRLDSKNLAQRRHDVYGIFGPSIFRVNASYLYLDRVALDNGNATRNREELTLGLNSSFADHWSAGIIQRRDVAKDGGPISAGLLLTYQDECFTFQLVGERDYTRRSGIDSGDRIFFRMVFKNLGEFLSPALSGNVFGGTSATTR
jgi:LPS-assembly protein